MVPTWDVSCPGSMDDLAPEDAHRLGLSESQRIALNLGVVYQIYPRSFQDTDGDGVGDLPGIIRRLDYLRQTGIGTVWLSPIYPSPMADFGYDVADHRDVDPVFGTLDDLDRLIEGAHRRAMRLILDYVPNHTSDRHPWFVESRASRGSPKRDWYVWADPAPDGGPPNNWWNHFDGGPAWTLDEATGQYYLHLFTPHQPDLNWRNPEVEAAMLEVLRFWLERGVDGFRVDVPSHLAKDPELRDEPPGPRWPEAAHPGVRTDDLPEVHEILRRLRQVVDQYPDRVLIGELWVPLERLAAYHGRGDEFHLPYNFQLMLIPWEADSVRRTVERYEALLPEDAWPNWVLGNHDRPRVASRLGPAQARVAMMALLTLRGTPTLYYGDELGMRDVPIHPKRILDPQGRADPGQSRDPARTPMRWDGGPNAGFCPPGAEPWLPIGDDHREVNVAAQEADPRSMLALTRALIHLRRTEGDLRLGPYESLQASEGAFAYRRGRHLAVALNFTSERVVWQAPRSGRVVLSTRMDRREATPGTIELRPDEGVVVRLARR